VQKTFDSVGTTRTEAYIFSESHVSSFCILFSYISMCCVPSEF
jgi:hypothetical protein